MESSSRDDVKGGDPPGVLATACSSSSGEDAPVVIADRVEMPGALQLQVDQNDITEESRVSVLHEEGERVEFQALVESPGSEGAAHSPPMNELSVKTEERSDAELATAYQYGEGSVPGSCETESSRSSPSNDGFSLLDGNTITVGRPRSSSLDSKRSTKSRSGNGLRRGKWTLEEENYVARVIQDFNSGFLDAPAGTTLRTYLSEKLQCDPMRITKKFTGDACIGKRVFHPAVRSPSNAAAIDRAQVRLQFVHL